MDTLCPHCKQRLTIKPSKPGRFAPRCPWCQTRLLFSVSDDPQVPIKIGLYPTDAAATPPPASPPAAKPETKSETKPEAVPAAGPPPIPADATDVLDATIQEVPLGSALSLIGVSGVNVASPPSSASNSSSVNAPDSGKTVRGAEATSAWTEPVTEAEVEAKAAEAEATRTQAEVSAAAPSEPLDVPEILGGYRVLRRLGQGAMGAVYLAKQISLNRSVAIKTIRPEVAKNPTAVARFTREAYAAAQLVHHNVVQIYDLAVDEGVNFFSMEFVQGQNLADLVRRQGKLPALEAAGLILQAARGLRFAHDNGMVHRDVKPANLMLNNQGIVKVADLGLVKLSAAALELKGGDLPAVAVPMEAGSLTGALDSQVTLARSTMGTAAYIAPEQIGDAHNVDHRADIYSLGCTFFVLLTGRSPFEGKNALEVMKRHQTEALPRADAIDPEVPQELADLIVKMTAKRPQDRSNSLEEVVKSLEEFLARGDGGTLKPRKEHIRELKTGHEEFNKASWRGIRALVPPVFILACAVLLLLSLWTGHWGVAGGLVAYAFATLVSYVILRGFQEEEVLLSRLRVLVLEANWVDLLIWIVELLVFLMLVLLLRLLIPLVAAVLLAVGTAAAIYFGLDRLLKAQRQPALERVEHVLLELRARGMDENDVRTFVALHSGDDWEEFVESLFGYETKIALRRQRSGGDATPGRQAYAAWREPLIRWIDRRVALRRKERERRHLQQVEELRLESEGVDEEEARRRAGLAANALVTQAFEIREALASALPGDKEAAQRQREIFRNMLNTARTGEVADRKRWTPALPDLGLLDAFLGPQMRLLAGGFLVALCAIWMQKNGLLPTSLSLEQVQQQVAAQGLNSTEGWMPAFGAAARAAVSQQATEVLTLPGFPERFRDGCTGPNFAVAGLILLLATLLRGRWVGFFVFPAAAVTVLGTSLGVPVLMSVHGYDVTAAAVGLGFLLAATFLGGSPSE